nr:uncharacterized protein LOC117227741 [Megalopta genalis]
MFGNATPKKAITFTKYSYLQLSHVFQRLIEEMTNYLDKAKSHEMAIFQRYVDKYSTYHGTSTLFHYCCATVVVVATLFLEQPFPVVTEYPFRVDYEPIRTIIFLNHSFVALQSSSSISLNTLTSLLLLFAAARFDIFMLHLGKAVTVADLKECMNMYYDVKRFMNFFNLDTHMMSLAASNT